MHHAEEDMVKPDHNAPLAPRHSFVVERTLDSVNEQLLVEPRLVVLHSRLYPWAIVFPVLGIIGSPS